MFNKATSSQEKAIGSEGKHDDGMLCGTFGIQLLTEQVREAVSRVSWGHNLIRKAHMN